MSFKITEYSVTGNLKQELSFAVVSDLHDFPNEGIISAIKAASPDGVLVVGDFIHGEFINSRGFEFLRLSAKEFPTFCCLGNHEAGYLGDLRSKIKESGAVLLDNEQVLFKGIRIGGLTSGRFYGRRGGLPDLDFLLRFSRFSEYKLLLCHHPEYYKPFIKELPIELTLSGHAHGGQWRLFGRGAYAPGQGILPKYTAGIYDGRLVVGRGLGNLYPIPRIGNCPEILMLRIKKQV